MVPLMRYLCTRTVPKHIELEVLGLALSEKQIPQIVEDDESGTERIEPLEGTGLRPRQMRYQAVLRPTRSTFSDRTSIPNPASKPVSGETVPKLYQNPSALHRLYQNYP